MQSTPVQQPTAAQAVSPYRPTSRPPIALLTVFDDGKNDGEVIRIRDHEFVIGRTEGDLQDPDRRPDLVAARRDHAPGRRRHSPLGRDRPPEHSRHVRPGQPDGAGRPGRVPGRQRAIPVRDAPRPGRGDRRRGAEPAGFGQTRGWADGPSPFRPPRVTELLGNEIGNRMLLVKPEYWIGSDPTCAICRPDDPFCEPRHVRLFRGSRAAGTPSTTGRSMASGSGWRRSSSMPPCGSRSASSGFRSRCSLGGFWPNAMVRPTALRIEDDSVRSGFEPQVKTSTSRSALLTPGPPEEPSHRQPIQKRPHNRDEIERNVV